MKYKRLIITLLSFMIALAIFQLGIFDMFVWFLIGGIIPGTDYVVSPVAMMLFYLLLSVAAVYAISGGPKNTKRITAPAPKRRTKKPTASRAKRIVQREKTLSTKRTTNRKITKAA